MNDELGPHHQSRHPMSRRTATARQEPIFQLLSEATQAIYQEPEPVILELSARVAREATHANARKNYARARLLQGLGNLVQDWHGHVTWQSEQTATSEHTTSEHTRSAPARRVRWPQTDPKETCNDPA